jgi:hypothetical protein
MLDADAFPFEFSFKKTQGSVESESDSGKCGIRERFREYQRAIQGSVESESDSGS